MDIHSQVSITAWHACISNVLFKKLTVEFTLRQIPRQNKPSDILVK